MPEEKKLMPDEANHTIILYVLTCSEASLNTMLTEHFFNLPLSVPSKWKKKISITVLLKSSLIG